MAIRFETPEERAKRIGQIDRKAVIEKAVKQHERLRVLEKVPQMWDDENKNVVRSAKNGKAKRAKPDTIRFPQEVKDFFGKGTPGWQKRINEVLLDYARKNRP